MSILVDGPKETATDWLMPGGCNAGEQEKNRDWNGSLRREAVRSGRRPTRPGARIQPETTAAGDLVSRNPVLVGSSTRNTVTCLRRSRALVSAIPASARLLRDRSQQDFPFEQTEPEAAVNRRPVKTPAAGSAGTRERAVIRHAAVSRSFAILGFERAGGTHRTQCRVR